MTELIRIIFDKNKNITIADLITEAILAYNESVHSATNLTPTELYRAHITTRKTKTGQTYTEYIENIGTEYEKQSETITTNVNKNKQRNIEKLNEKRVKPPRLTNNDTIFEKQHTRDKTKPKYIEHIVTKNNPGPTITTNKRTVHKKKI